MYNLKIKKKVSTKFLSYARILYWILAQAELLVTLRACIHAKDSAKPVRIHVDRASSRDRCKLTTWNCSARTSRTLRRERTGCVVRLTYTHFRREPAALFSKGDQMSCLRLQYFIMAFVIHRQRLKPFEPVTQIWPDDNFANKTLHLLSCFFTIASSCVNVPSGRILFFPL